MSYTEEELNDRLAQVTETYGAWSEDIPLPYGKWTKGNGEVPHRRLKRSIQIIRDVMGGHFESARILDLGCLDGIYSIECALQGAHVLGIDVRKGHIEKCLLAKRALQLENLDFRTGDVRAILAEPMDPFDVILCSGLLYHLNAPDVFDVIERIYERTLRVAIFDTHVSLNPTSTVSFREKLYHGHTAIEHGDNATPADIEDAGWSSFGNRASFWLTRPSLVNALAEIGFSSVYECLTPPLININKPGVAHRDRCTFVCLKGEPVTLKTSPVTNTLAEDWPENALDYSQRPQCAPRFAGLRSLLRQARGLLFQRRPK